MRRSTVFAAALAACVLLSSCAADTPKDRPEDSDTYAAEPMARTGTGDNKDADAGKTAGAADKQGEKVYKTYCVTCHMGNGQGLSGVYPPLAGAEFLADKAKTVDAVANGLQGKITVKGKEYNNMMPPIPGSYSNADVAAVINYVVATFGKGGWTVTEAEVAAVRKK